MKKLFLLALIVASFQAHCMKIDELITNTLELGETANTVRTIDQDHLEFEKLRIRLRGKVGLEIPFLSSLELKVFVEPHFK